MFLASSSVASGALLGPYLRDSSSAAEGGFLNILGPTGDVVASVQSGASGRRQNKVVSSSSLQIISAGSSIVPGADRTLKI